MSEVTPNEVDLSTAVPAGLEEIPPVELSMDDLFKIAVDTEGAKKVLTDALAPAGTYTTEPPFIALVQRTKDGREYARLFGNAILGDQTQKMGYSISWQRRNRKDQAGQDTGKPDNMSLLYSFSLAAYKAVYGQEPETIGQVVKYLSDYPHRITVIQIGTGPNAKGTPGNMVVGITAITA